MRRSARAVRARPAYAEQVDGSESEEEWAEVQKVLQGDTTDEDEAFTKTPPCLLYTSDAADE